MPRLAKSNYRAFSVPGRPRGLRAPDRFPATFRRRFSPLVSPDRTLPDACFPSIVDIMENLFIFNENACFSPLGNRLRAISAPNEFMPSIPPFPPLLLYAAPVAIIVVMYGKKAKKKGFRLKRRPFSSFFTVDVCFFRVNNDFYGRLVDKNNCGML